MTEKYDSTDDTMKHIRRVQALMTEVRGDLQERARVHDQSKFSKEEKPLFDEMTPLLKTLTYGSDEYKASLDKLKPALDHHYASNDHHPEYYQGKGVAGMTITALVEMLCDWKAASERTADGDIMKSIEIGAKRFGLDPQIVEIFQNTARTYGWDRK